MTEHFDLETLAEFREGNLPRRQAAGIRSHLAGCPDCAAAAGQVAAVTEAIARAPAAAMPPEVAARISAAITAEAQARAPGAVAASAGPSLPHGIPAQPVPAGEVPAKPVPAQAGAGSGPAGRPGTGAPAGRPGSRSRPGLRSRRSLSRQRNALRALAAAAVVVVVGGGGYAISQLASPGGQHAASGSSSRNAPSRTAGTAMGARNPTSSPPTVASGTDYTPAGLAGQVRAVLDRNPSTSAGHLPPRTGAARRPLNNLSTLQACVTKLTGGREPRLVDKARYRGQAAIVVVTTPAGGHQSMVLVAGAGCSPGHPDILARLALPARG